MTKPQKITVPVTEIKVGDILDHDGSEVVKVVRDRDWFPNWITITSIIEDDFVAAGVIAERAMLDTDDEVTVLR